MGISDEKRREVAENLRLIDDGIIDLMKEQICHLTDEELDANVVFGLGLRLTAAVAGLETTTLGKSWELLADLIGPTCEYVPIGEERFGCSECGNTVRLDYDVPVTDETPMPFKHCPNCGARVVSGDGD